MTRIIFIILHKTIGDKRLLIGINSIINIYCLGNNTKRNILGYNNYESNGVSFEGLLEIHGIHKKDIYPKEFS